MKKYIELVEKSPLLNCLPKEEVHSCLKDGSFRISTYGKNNIIHFSGEACRSLEIILTGQVSVERIDEEGNLMNIAEFYADEILGGNLLFSKNPYYPMTVTAKQPTTIVEIDKERLLVLASGNLAFLRSYLEFVADHTTILGDRIKHYVNKTIRECIMSYLEHERKKQGSNRILLPITKKAWAERIGVSRTSLSRELAKMKKDGLIRYDAKAIELL
ncbi:MAG: Crp/Fnr family transcriptional regulator [Clostridiales bacterium]|nr:Crp/Fnr family transcriptional regulator [Clostridiales bacterium]